MARRTSKKPRKKRKCDSLATRNVLIPALLTALSVSILVYLLALASFDLKFGAGSSAILFASFGSSAFILFMMPRSSSARLSKFAKSYIIAGIIGASGYLLLKVIPLYVVAGIVILLTAIVMDATHSRHPPAVGIALAFVLYRINLNGVIIVALGVLLLIILRAFLERFVFMLEEEIAEEFNKI